MQSIPAMTHGRIRNGIMYWVVSDIQCETLYFDFRIYKFKLTMQSHMQTYMSRHNSKEISTCVKNEHLMIDDTSTDTITVSIIDGSMVQISTIKVSVTEVIIVVSVVSFLTFASILCMQHVGKYLGQMN